VRPDGNPERDDRSGGVSSVRGNRLVQSEEASAGEIQRLIGEKLKEQYDLAEPIPDRLVELLKKLAQLVDERDGETE
jgi:hypothetical protein